MRKLLVFFCVFLVLTVLVASFPFSPIQLGQVKADTTIPEAYVYVVNNQNLGAWTNPTYAYNNVTSNGATKAFAGVGWSTYLVLNLSDVARSNPVSPIQKIRYWVGRSNTAITTMQIDVANQSGAWRNVFSATPTYSAYANASFASTSYMAMRVRFYNSGTTSRTATIYEVQAVSTTWTIPSSFVNISKWDDSFQITGFASPYPITTYSDANGAQLNITLFQMPSVNTWNFSLTYKNLKFYYQPPLNEMLNVSLYDFVNATHAIKGGVVMEYRPENVVGSYAVYGNHQGNQYATGKFFHIYRPLLIDALGKTIWGDMNITSGVLTITANQTFLNTATYPVVIDPTFGLTTKGADQCAMDAMRGCNVTVTETGTVTLLNAYIAVGSSGKNIKIGLYNSSKLLVGNTDPISVSTSGWKSGTVSIPVVAGVYYFGIICDTSSTVTVAFDTVSGYSDPYTSYTYPTFPANWGTDTWPNRRYSIFANYTVPSGTNYVADLSQSASTTWNCLVQSNFNVVSSQSATSTWNILPAWNALLVNSQSVTTTLDTLIQWNALVTLSQSASTTLDVLAQWNAIATLTQNFLTTYSVLAQWNALAILSQSFTTTLDVLVQSNFNIVTSLSTTFSWLTAVTIGIHHTVDLTLSILASWLIQIRWNAIVTIDQSLTTTWNVLIQTNFNVVNSLDSTFSWAVDIVQGLQYTVDLTVNVVTSWAVDVFQNILLPMSPEEAAGIGIAFSIMVLGVCVGLIYSKRKREE